MTLCHCHDYQAQFSDEDTGAQRGPAVTSCDRVSCVHLQEPVTTRSRTQKGERARRLWRNTSFQTWRTQTQTQTWMKTRMRMRTRARMSRQDHPRRHPCPARRPRCQQTPHPFRARSPQMPPLATRPCGAAQSQKQAVAPGPAKASCASLGWGQPFRAPWRRIPAQP